MKKQQNPPHIGRLASLPYFEMIMEGHKRLSSKGLDAFDPSYSLIFQFIGDGSRITDIAQTTNTPKQNIKYLIDRLEAKGYLRREKDPTDKRARIYKLSEKGITYRDKELKINLEIEAEWTRAIGKHNMKKLKDLLSDLAAIIQNNI